MKRDGVHRVARAARLPCRAPAWHPADVSRRGRAQRRSSVFRETRNTAGGTPALPETRRSPAVVESRATRERWRRALGAATFLSPTRTCAGGAHFGETRRVRLATPGTPRGRRLVRLRRNRRRRQECRRSQWAGDFVAASDDPLKRIVGLEMCGRIFLISRRGSSPGGSSTRVSSVAGRRRRLRAGRSRVAADVRS